MRSRPPSLILFSLDVKRFSALLFTLVVVAITATTQSDAADEQTELTAAVDALCEATGLRRVSPVELAGSDRHGRHLKATLAADKREMRYDITFEWSGKVASFMPQKFAFGDVGLGYDTLPKGPEREMCIRITRPLGERLGWKWVSGPVIQRVREDFVVTYITMSEEEQTAAMQGPKMVFLHPYVSFLVTPKGSVFGGFHGS